MKMGRTRRVHFVGVGGIGMSGIAEVLATLGYEVSGSDRVSSPITERLEQLGVRVAIGHDPSHLGAADVVVVSSAVAQDNPELEAARARGVPVIPRAEMLAELMRLRFGIAVAGSHGKTTTTTMVALMLEHAGLDPTAIIGGRVSAFGSTARLGQGQVMVAEADESDRSFLTLSPSVAVVTNIDREHLDAYDSVEGLLDAFAAFANRVPFYGAVIACVDDPVVVGWLPRVTRRTMTYGFADVADVRGEAPRLDGGAARCDVRYRLPVTGESGTARLELGIPGRHNLQNALGAFAVGLELDVPVGRIIEALRRFAAPERRHQQLGTAHGITVVDDYGHHPTEIAATLQAVRDGRPARIVAVFQPHRYSRTRDLMDAFGPALSHADVVVLTDIYSAGEAPVAGVSLETLSAAVREAVPAVQVVPALEAVPGVVAKLARVGDVVVTLGAGSIGRVGPRILAALAAQGVGT